MRKANGIGCYGRELSGLSKLISFEMGLQIPCGVYPEEETKGPVRAGTTPPWQDISCLGSAERVPNSGRSSGAIMNFYSEEGNVVMEVHSFHREGSTLVMGKAFSAMYLAPI